MNDYISTIRADFGAFLPNLLAAIAVLVIGWLVAWLVAAAVKAILQRTTLDDRLARLLAADDDADPPRTEVIISKIVFWVLMAVVLVAFFQVLGLGFVARPIDSFLGEIFGYLPNLLSAGLLVLVAWLIARLLRFLVRRGAEAAQLDDRFNRGQGEERPRIRLSKTLGETAYWLIFLLFLPAILDALAIDAITRPASEMVDRVLLAIPQLFAAALVILIAWLVGRVLAGFVTNILAAIGFDDFLARIGLVRRSPAPAAGTAVDAPGAPMRRRTPSEIAGLLVLVALVLFAVIEALDLLAFDQLSLMVTEFALFAGDVLLAVLIFALGVYLAKMAADAIRTSGANQAELLASAARAGILVLVTAMALRQTGIGDEVILLAFGLLLGAIAVATAIAFGIGGRELARRKLEEWASSVEEGGEAGGTPPRSSYPTGGAPEGGP